MLGTLIFIMHRFFGPKSLFQVSDPHCTSVVPCKKSERPCGCYAADSKGLSGISRTMFAICLISNTGQKNSKAIFA